MQGVVGLAAQVIKACITTLTYFLSGEFCQFCLDKVVKPKIKFIVLVIDFGKARAIIHCKGYTTAFT